MSIQHYELNIKNTQTYLCKHCFVFCASSIVRAYNLPVLFCYIIHTAVFFLTMNHWTSWTILLYPTDKSTFD